MSLALLVLHMMIAAALVGVVLLQKSEGGALGIGGGGGFLTGRGTANLLTRTTSILAAAFFTTSLTLTLLASHSAPTGSIIEKTVAPAGPAPAAPAPAAGDASKPADASKTEGHGILDKLQAPAEQIPR